MTRLSRRKSGRTTKFDLIYRDWRNSPMLRMPVARNVSHCLSRVAFTLVALVASVIAAPPAQAQGAQDSPAAQPEDLHRLDALAPENLHKRRAKPPFDL